MFAIHLLVGLAVFADYGVHWDEMNNQRFGNRWFDYCVQVLSTRSLEPLPAMEKHDYIHGPSFELLLIGIERAAGLRDSRSVILMRHAAVFCLFHLGSICFFFLCRRLFGSWKLGLLGFAFLVVHPRIFAHSFFNSVDLPFLSFYIMALFTLIKLLDETSLRAAALHALACAFLITVRAPGVFVVACTFTFLLADFAVLRATRSRQLLLVSAVYGLLVSLFSYLMWPLIWSDPWGMLSQAGEQTKYAIGSTPPWYYNFVWFSVTTPLLIVGLFLAGLGAWTFSAAQELGTSAARFYRQHRLFILLMLLLAVPVALPIVLGTRLFGGWRHHYFVYPVIVVFSAYGARTLSRVLGTHGERARMAITTAVLVAGLGWPLTFMVRAHPHQQVYANPLAGEHLEHARYRGSLDYWGVSYRQLIEHLLENRDGRLRVWSRYAPGRANVWILEPDQRERIRIRRQINPKDRFFITNFRRGPQPFPLNREVYSIEILGEKISAVYERPE